jgi:hypothetical protein
MLPEAKTEDLLYVSDQGTSENNVDVFSFPAGQLVGTLTGFDVPSGLCTDTKGNVFVTDTRADEIVEYAHGGTSPISTLQDSGSEPSGCAIDPNTGNLAVTNIFGSGTQYDHGSVVVYQNASGLPSTYKDPQIYWYEYCTYDDKSDLFVSGYVPYSDFLIGELPKGKSKFKNITVRNHGSGSGNVQWVGKYLLITDAQSGYARIDRVALIPGNIGVIVDTIDLDGQYGVNSAAAAQFDVFGGKTIIMPYSSGYYSPGLVGIWHYPAGGNPIKMIDGFGYALGVTVSPKVNR